MRTLLAIFVFTFAVAGCQSTTVAEKCQGYGLAKGSEQFMECIYNEEARRDDKSRTLYQMMEGQRRQNYDQQMRAIRQQQQRRPVNCTTYYVGNQARTTCQ